MQLEEEYHQGDLTEKGFLKRKAKLLAPFGHLVTANGSLFFGTTTEPEALTMGGGGERGDVAKNGGMRTHHVELLQDGGGGRKLLSVTEEEMALADTIARTKHKELTQANELRR